MGCQEDLLVAKICDLYKKISTLDCLKPSEDVNTLFTQLVDACIPPSPIDVSKLPMTVQSMRSELIKLCGQAEGHLESHYSTLLGSLQENPLRRLDIFPYFSNYLKLGRLEFNILRRHLHFHHSPAPRVAFVGSGPLPLTSIVLATYYLTASTFHNYDIDPSANSMASKLVSSDPDLSGRMFFHTADIMNVTDELKEYEVVFLAALVGMDKEEKERVVEHLAKHMSPGAILMLRSAHGARAFLYPVVDPSDLRGFQVLSVYHPTDEVINSVVIARKYPTNIININSHDKHELGLMNHMMLPCKCSEINSAFNPLNQMAMIEELAIEEHLA